MTVFLHGCIWHQKSQPPRPSLSVRACGAMGAGAKMVCVYLSLFLRRGGGTITSVQYAAYLRSASFSLLVGDLGAGKGIIRFRLLC